MQSSKDFLKNKGIMTRISFKESPVHTVKLLSDSIESIKDEKGEEVEGVKYLVEENGEKKSFFTSSVGLMQRLAEYKEGSTVTIEMKSKKKDGKWISYFEVYSDEEKELSEKDVDEIFEGR